MTDNSNLEWHDATEMPEFYPDRLIPAEVEDKKGVLLAGCHSKYYKPTEEAKKVLQAKLKKFQRWAYLQEKVNRR